MASANSNAKKVRAGSIGSLGGWEVDPTPRISTRGLGQKRAGGEVALSKGRAQTGSLFDSWGETPRVTPLISGVWPKAFDGGNLQEKLEINSSYESDEELGLFVQSKSNNEEMSSSSSPGFNMNASPYGSSSPTIPRLTPPLILPLNKSPIPPSKVGLAGKSNSRRHDRPPSVCSTIPFRSRNRLSDSTTKEYGNKFYTPLDKDYYKSVIEAPKTAGGSDAREGGAGLSQGESVSGGAKRTNQ